MSKPRVSSRQAKALLICSGKSDCPQNCPNWGLDYCTVTDITDVMLAQSLLEAYGLIGEMRDLISELSSRIYDISMFPKDESAANEAEAILEKSKEWV